MMINDDPLSLFERAFNEGLKPDTVLTVSEWADAFRFLSQTASSEPGRFRTERTPYLKEIMDALSSESDIEKVVFMKGAQVGGTEAGNNWVGYVIDQAPGPMLVVQPTVEMGKRWSKGRLAPLIEDTKILKEKIKNPRSRDSGNTVQSKEFPGGVIVITGANSAVGLRSMPVKYLFLDEIDAYPFDAGSEGDPVNLAIKRTETFSKRKIFLVSTPTIKGLSRVEKEFIETDQRYFFVPCPYCGHYQILKWENIKYDTNFETTYACEQCERHIEESYKTDMLKRGEWRATKEGSNPKTIGFHLSSLYSPLGWFSWEACVREYEEAKKDDQRLKVWTNTTLGLPWEDKGDCPDWTVIFNRRENYKIRIVPRGAYILTAGVDVQNDRLEMEIVGWGANRESWSVDYRIIYGSPGDEKTWQNLSKILDESFESEDGNERKISMLAIDSGFSTSEVYAWVRTQSPYSVLAIKGQDSLLTPLSGPTRVDINLKGKKLKRGVNLWRVGVSILKGEIYNNLKKQREDDKEFPRGYMHFPEYNNEYFKQLTAEQLVVRVVKGYPRREWIKTRDRNEALDCRVYARAAAIALGIDKWDDEKWEELANPEKPTPKKQRPRYIPNPWIMRDRGED